MSLNVFWSRLLRWDGSLHQTIRLLALGVPFPIIGIDEGVLFNWRVIPEAAADQTRRVPILLVVAWEPFSDIAIGLVVYLDLDL